MSNYNPKEAEEKVLKFWKENKMFEKSLQKDSPKGSYIFYDGPPFITGLPHYATLLPSIIKDAVPRYWTMKGYHVERVWGWDCHGLPAENKVEQQLGLKNKKDIENLGIGNFINACRKYVEEGSEQWRWYIDRIGRWVDMDNAYRTMDLGFMESVIWAFKELYKKGLIYEDYRTSLHCPRCATPLSKFEITMDAGSYRTITEKSIVVKFKLKNEDNTYVLVWTTTPWTLPGNFALAVGENIDYVKVECEGEYYILAENRVKEILKGKKYEIKEHFKGSKLFGLRYEPIFETDNKEIKNNENVYKIYTDDFVTTEDGTGIVHIAQNFGEDDFNFGKKYNLPFIDIMDENGYYTDEAGEWKGTYFKDANKKVVEKLGNKLFSAFDFTHQYPFCYRCSTPLIYKTQKAWYLNISSIRQKLLDTNKLINWIPEFFKEGRFEYNLRTAPDWCLSRSRYWGSPIPVWKCEKCLDEKVVGSIKEIEELSGKEIKDLHKPDIDEITFACEKCSGTMKRVPEVLDCWFESGSMPFAQWHYPFKRKEEFKKIFPADFIVEYTGQLRGWFYYLHVLSNCLFDSISFKNVIVTGVLAGTDGRKMSKSYGNYPDPREVLEKYGSDALRYYFMSSPILIGEDMSLSEKNIEESLRKTVMLFWNVYKFYEIYEDEVSGHVDIENTLDKWILSRLNSLNKEITEGMESYNIPRAVRPIERFINELSTWYLRLSRDRFKSSNKEDRKSVLWTTRHVLLESSKLFAPFIPFISEYVWQKIEKYDFNNKDKSVHLCNWPEPDEGRIDKALENRMEIIKKIVEASNSIRQENNIKLKYALKSIIISGNKEVAESVKMLEGILKKMANVKEVEITEDKIKYEAKINYAVAGKELGKDVSKLKEVLSNIDANKLKEIFDEKNEEVINGIAVKRDYIIFKEVSEKGDSKRFDQGLVRLNLEISEELKEEWLLREIVRAIQNKRKEMGLKISDKAKVYLPPELKYIEDEVKRETGSIVAFDDAAEFENEIEFEGKKYGFKLEKL